MKQPINIQDQVLNQLRKDGTYVTVFLLNGFQIRGQVKAFDNFTVLIESEENSSSFTSMRSQHLHRKEMYKLTLKHDEKTGDDLRFFHEKERFRGSGSDMSGIFLSSIHVFLIIV